MTATAIDATTAAASIGTQRVGRLRSPGSPFAGAGGSVSLLRSAAAFTCSTANSPGVRASAARGDPASGIQSGSSVNSFCEHVVEHSDAYSEPTVAEWLLTTPTLERSRSATAAGSFPAQKQRTRHRHGPAPAMCPRLPYDCLAHERLTSCPEFRGRGGDLLQLTVILSL